VGQEKLKDYAAYCVRELAVNAKKANTKRVYFMERGLDINIPDDYKIGMENFKADTLENIAHYLQLQKEKGLYIKLIFQVKGNVIYIEVRNNVAVTKTELIRIHDKLARSRQYNSLEEALTQVLDDSEGAGLGLVILVLMLKKSVSTRIVLIFWAPKRKPSLEFLYPSIKPGSKTFLSSPRPSWTRLRVFPNFRKTS